MAHLRDRLGARDRHLEHAAAGVPSRAAQRLLDRLAVERGPRRGRRRRGRWTQRRRAGRERLAERGGELHGVAVAFVVHVHDVG